MPSIGDVVAALLAISVELRRQRSELLAITSQAERARSQVAAVTRGSRAPQVDRASTSASATVLQLQDAATASAAAARSILEYLSEIAPGAGAANELTSTPSLDSPPSTVSWTPTAIVVASQARELQSLLPEGSRGRVTMAVGIGRDGSGTQRMVIGTSERNGYLRLGVRAALRPGDKVAMGNGHAEANILAHMKTEDIKPGPIAAGRPICPACTDEIYDAGAYPASPVRMP